METVNLRFFHKGTQLHEVNVSIDEMNKLIGILHYGGWKKNLVKYVIEDYYLVEFSPLEVHVKLQTEDEAMQKHINQLSGLSPEFKEKLVPVFQRKTKEELN